MSKASILLRLLDRFKYQLVILVFGLLVFWPMMNYLLKWDNLDAFLPYRHFLSSTFSTNGSALWMPYQMLGYPIHSDPQSGYWYPFTWLSSLLGGYGVRLFNLEVLLHFLIAGWAMFKLSRTLKLSRMIALILGLCYMCSGIILGTSHIYPSVIGAAWLPFILAYAIEYKANPSGSNALKLALVFSLCLSGAYPSYTIIAAYFLGLYFLHWAFSGIRFSRWCKYAVIPLLAVIVLSAGHLYSIAEVLPYIQRSSALEYNEFFFSNSFTLRSWISFIAPYSTATALDYFDTDPSMMNGYFGALLIPFVLLALTDFGKKRVWLLLVISGVFLMASMGDGSPVRYWMYRFLPGFDLFRHPSILRVYSTLGIILLGGFGLQQIEIKRDGLGLWFQSIFTLSIVFYFIYLMGITSMLDLEQVWAFFSSNEGSSQLPLSSHSCFTLIPLILLSLLVSGGYWAYRSTKLGKGALMGLILCAVMLDLGWTSRLQLPITVYNNIAIEDQVAGFEKFSAFPGNQNLKEKVSDIDMKTLGGGVPGIWRNLGIWKKRTAIDGYNPFHLSNHDLIKKDSALLSHPIVFSSIEEALVSDLMIGSDRFSVSVNSSVGHELHLLQNAHPNWRVYVDGKDAEIALHRNIPSVKLDKGGYSVLFQYEDHLVNILFLIGVLAWGFSLFIVALPRGPSTTLSQDADWKTHLQ